MQIVISFLPDESSIYWIDCDTARLHETNERFNLSFSDHPHCWDSLHPGVAVSLSSLRYPVKYATG